MKILVIHINLRIFIIYKNNPSIIAKYAKSDITSYILIFCKTFFRTTIFNILITKKSLV